MIDDKDCVRRTGRRMLRFCFAFNIRFMIYYLEDVYLFVINDNRI